MTLTQPHGLSVLARGLTDPRGFGDASLLADAPPDTLRLLAGTAAAEALPIEDIARASAAVWTDRQTGVAALRYTQTPGFPGLREWLARREGVDARRIVITNGGMHGLSLAVLTVVERGATVAVDDPVFPLFVRALEVSTDRLLPVPVVADGLDVDHLAARLRAGEQVAAVYTVPDFHNPTQVTLSAEKRVALVALAERFGFYLIVDNPYRELRFAGQDQGVAAFNQSDRAIHVNTFTKTLGAGWRLGWLVLPEHLVAPVVKLRNRGDSHTPTVTQTLIENLVTDHPGWYDDVVARANLLYAERSHTLIEALHTQLPGTFSTTAPEGGLFLWPRLTDPTVDAAALHQRAAAHGLAYQQGGFFAVGPQRESERHLRIAYSNHTPAQLQEAVRRLALAVHG
ncbi:aminotransferase-like domain-containing protein [Nakamurella leprariae]|uniref:PLP-dependent aminotransferase family protein n=1 Tax=Nakamurella leprariae TaxID=2803911 RepID=A0A939BXK2_9ACTN|nr:PLP-dependent aminotransferase family protein [Nakamurella leprariae]MBM9465671.1 PLP-dependent aminotransferase family protein [Nakamurella leprariae]